MAASPHLLFSLRSHLFGIDAGEVAEVTRLPALEPLPEAPPHVAGVFDLRGSLVPVVDLAVRMGYEPTRRLPSQAVVILAHGGATTGVLVDRIEDLVLLDEDDAEDAPQAPAGVPPSPEGVVRRLVRAGARVATLLDVDALLFEPRPEDLRRPGGELPRQPFDAPEEAMPLLRERARRLAAPPAAPVQDEGGTLVLVQLAGETFAVHAPDALEFVRLEEVAPVPCCPRHVVGHASLRGDIVVIIDVRPALALQADRHAAPERYAVLVRSPQGPPMGILLDKVVGVTQATPSEQGEAGGGAYVRGSVLHEERRIPILDVAQVAASPEFVVKEEV